MFETKKRRRQRLMNTSFPPDWLETVKRNVPYYSILAQQDQVELQGLVQVFLSEKRFEGLGGLRITDEIRLTIAAQACILLLRRRTDFYPLLVSVLVYPKAFVAPMKRQQPGGIVSEGEQVLSGQTWGQGSLVLSWDDVLRGAANPRDGFNVVFHEFAHQLDSEAGAADGAPLLPDTSMYDAWERICVSEYRELIRNIEENRPTLIRAYAATSPAEFFAVSTELFFERPAELREWHAELYQLLQMFYLQDPASFLRVV